MPAVICGTPAIRNDIADADARRARHPVGDQFGAIGDARHPQPRLGQPDTARRIIAFQNRPRFGVDDDIDVQRLGDRIDGDVVVRRADPAGGEKIVVAGA